MAKYHYTLESTWVARAPGCRTGYGKTPSEAHRAIKQAERDQAQRTTSNAKRLRAAADAWSARVSAAQQEAADKASREVYSLRTRLRQCEERARERKTDDDCLLMMAMVHFKTSDPHAALEKLREARRQAGATDMLAGYERTADRVAAYVNLWTERLGPVAQ